MGQRLLGLVLLVISVLVIVGSGAHRAERGAPMPPVTAPTPALPAAVRQPSLLPNPNAGAPPQGTPEIDMLAVLAVRRRIEREGGRVYLNAMLTDNDSILVRWADRVSHTYTVAFIPDTTLKGWTHAALTAAQSGMQAWSGNSAGIILVPAPDSTPADIEVRWSPVPGRQREIGGTQTTWSREGVISHAAITLSLAFDDSTAISPSERNRAAAHEFGHALGLPHSNLPGDLMFARSDQDGPSSRDQATLLLLYTVPPGSIKLNRPMDR